MINKTRIGPFEISGRLGSHRRHRVFRARQVEQDRYVALKFIRLPPDVDINLAVGKIQREVEALKRLTHPNLVRVYGAGIDGDEIFFAYDLIEGESLASLLSRRQKLSPDLAVDFGRQIAAALQYLHEHEIVHGKLTPDKIMIDPANRVHLLDVRLNRAKRKAWGATDRRELDSAAYMAPEQFDEGACEKSDLYSLGAILFEMLTGRIHLAPDTLPRLQQQKLNTRPPSVSEIELDCTIWLDRLVFALLQPDPRRRPHSAQAVGLALEEIKKVDQNLTPVVNQMTSGFNALTAGADKTEAKRLLGHEVAPRHVTPVHQRMWVQVAVLIAIVSLIVYSAWPPSNEKLWRQGIALADSSQLKDLNRAVDHFDRIVARGGTDQLSERARQHAQETRGKILRSRVVSGYIGLEPKTRLFADAYEAESSGQWELALRKYASLIEQVQADPDLHYFVVEANKRIETIRVLSAESEQPTSAQKTAESEPSVPQLETPANLTDED